MCISLVVPRLSVFATEIDGNNGLEEKTESVVSEATEESVTEEKINEETVTEEKVNEETKEKESLTENQGEESVEKDKTTETEKLEEPEKSGESEESEEAPEEEEGLLLSSKLPLLGAGADEPVSGAHGSGSYQLNEVPDDYRFYTEYYVGAIPGKSYTTAGVDRRTSIQVYAKQGEIILFGSSVSNSQINENNESTDKATNQDIVITETTGNKKSFDVLAPDATHPNGRGYIANPTQEKNGPMVNHTDEVDTSHKYYTPLRYDVPEDGIYTFEFHSVKGVNDGKSPTPKLAKDEKWDQGNNTVAAWDVTVLGKDVNSKWEVKEGRAWADYLALTTGGGEGKKSDLNLHVLTHDGYVYKVDFEEAVPFGFIFFANNTGFMTSVKDENGTVVSYRPIYHSFYDSTNDLDHMTDKENIYLHKPNEADTATEETYKIFFNRPSTDLDGAGIITTPDVNITLSDLKFTGIGSNLARAGHGGHFTFTSSGEAMVTIRLDLRKAIFDSESTMDAYEGTGIVEITAPAVAGPNNFYWDGKDTEGYTIPAGIYGNNNVVLSSEVKQGELHFPVIDMEGLYDGLHVERLNGVDLDNNDKYNLYYNNNPLAYGTIEGKDAVRNTKSGYDILSDGTKSYVVSAKVGGMTYFANNQDVITTLVKDTRDYLAIKFFNTTYDQLSSEYKSIIDAEFGKEDATYHFEPINSHSTSMKFECKEYNGGGNQAGIDAWTYYTQGVTPHIISFALLNNADSGVIRGQIFYDTNKDSKYDPASGDYLLPNMKVRLIGSDGKPLVHEEMLPVFDKSGHFVYDEDGKVKHELRSIEYEALTDASGNYRFTGVPYASGGNTEYYVQVC